MPKVHLEGVVREECIVLGPHDHSEAIVLECRVYFSDDPDDYDIYYRLSNSPQYYNNRLPIKQVKEKDRWYNRNQRR